MSAVQVNFVGEVSELDVAALHEGENVTTKLILSIDDFAIFRYREYDTFEVESRQGYRLPCQITAIETLKTNERVIVILSLKYIRTQTAYKIDLAYKCSSA